jgi:hypothetical protein
MQSIDVVPAVSGNVVSTQLEDPLRRAVAAYPSWFKGRSRVHSESDLCAFLTWCEEQTFVRCRRLARTWSCTCGGCRKSAGSSPRPCPGGSRSWPGSTGSAIVVGTWAFVPIIVLSGVNVVMFEGNARRARRSWDEQGVDPTAAKG